MNNVSKYVIRVLPGLLFLISAAAKLLDMDSFEIYLFSFGFVSLETAYYTARLVVCAEFSTGLLLLTNLYKTIPVVLASALTAVFSIFLIWMKANGNDGNCHCFGEFIDLNPIQSLLKNGIILILLALSANCKPFKCRFKKSVLLLSVILPIAVTFIASPPDCWYYDKFSRHTDINEDIFHEAISSGELPSNILDGEHIVCFYSLKCEFCRMSAEKIATLRYRDEFSEAPVTILFGRGSNSSDPSSFFGDTGLHPDNWEFIDPSLFLKITKGEMPLILILNDGIITAKYSYRDLHSNKY